jgi:hypothetical protein
MTLAFSLEKPLFGLSSLNTSIFDAHVHLWEANSYQNLRYWNLNYGITNIMGIATPEVKNRLEELNQDEKIVFGYYLSPTDFREFNVKKLVSAVDEAYAEGYVVIKMWFGPRFLDYGKVKKPFSIDHNDYAPIFSRIEDYKMIVDIHISDPDIWYKNKYIDKKKYRTKKEAIKEFSSVLEGYPSLKFIGVHFACFPEHLNHLSELLDTHPNLFIDTASTKWMVRELGSNVNQSKNFFSKFSDRILFATDLSVGGNKESIDEYFATRLWSQRLFWETNVIDVNLPFPDKDNEQQTVINGLNLSEVILEKIYWKNASELFGI